MCLHLKKCEVLDGHALRIADALKKKKAESSPFSTCAGPPHSGTVFVPLWSRDLYRFTKMVHYHNKPILAMARIKCVNTPFIPRPLYRLECTIVQWDVVKQIEHRRLAFIFAGTGFPSFLCQKTGGCCARVQPLRMLVEQS